MPRDMKKLICRFIPNADYCLTVSSIFVSVAHCQDVKEYKSYSERMFKNASLCHKEVDSLIEQQRRLRKIEKEVERLVPLDQNVESLTARGNYNEVQEVKKL